MRTVRQTRQETRLLIAASAGLLASGVGVKALTDLSFPRPRADAAIGMRSFSIRLIEFALAVVAVALLLNWAWQLLQPLLPVALVATGFVVLVAACLRRYRRW